VQPGEVDLGPAVFQAWRRVAIGSEVLAILMTSWEIFSAFSDLIGKSVPEN
jgi:hypothetical protein